MPMNEDDDEHDPWNEPEHRHPRARELMPEELFDCADEDAPFGSDEGAEAYLEYRDWRAQNPGAPLTECLEWIGDESDYPDAFTFDATIIATVLGQLVAEGRVDAAAKPAARRAIERQLLDAGPPRRQLLEMSAAAIEAA